MYTFACHEPTNHIPHIAPSPSHPGHTWRSHLLEPVRFGERSLFSGVGRRRVEGGGHDWWPKKKTSTVVLQSFYTVHWVRALTFETLYLARPCARGAVPLARRGAHATPAAGPKGVAPRATSHSCLAARQSSASVMSVCMPNCRILLAYIYAYIYIFTYIYMYIYTHMYMFM